MDDYNGQEKSPLPANILADELAKDWDSTERLDARLESFHILKQKGFDFLEWAMEAGIATANPQAKKLFLKLFDCGQYLIFRNYLVSKQSRLLGACTCKLHLLCPFCASRRGIKHSRIYKEKVDHLKAQANDKLDLVFITFTVKNGADLHERFTHLRNSMRFLLKQRNNQRLSKGTHKTEMAKLTGGVFAYEFKRGSGSQDWHPHIHMLAMLPKNSQVDIAILKQEWLDITGDSSVINIKRADDNGYLEVFAYALKFSEMENIDRWDAFNLLRRERLISSFGDLRGVELPEEETDDLLDSNEPFVDVLYRWCLGRGYENHGIVSK
jgi:hypothetical protein